MGMRVTGEVGANGPLTRSAGAWSQAVPNQAMPSRNDNDQLIGVTRSVIVTDAADVVVDPGHIGGLADRVVAPMFQPAPYGRLPVSAIAADQRLLPPVGDLGEGAGLRRFQHLLPERLAVFVLK